MSCKVQTNTNKQDSILFDTIYDGIANGNLEEAKKHYAYFENNAEFLKDFATDNNGNVLNWNEDFKKPFLERSINSRRLDDNGEPKLEFDNKYGKYFYKNEKNIKVYYPPSKNKLTSIYTNEAIRTISKKLALNFVNDRIGDNFNEFDLTENNVTLRQSIEEKLRSKAAQLKASPDFAKRLKSKNILKSIDNIDEWVKHVENYFREIKLVYKETNETEDLEEEENSERGQSFGMASFEKSTKDNISSNIKLRLSLLVNNLVSKDAKEDEYFYEPELKNFDEVYSDLLHLLTDKVVLEGEDLYESYLIEIQNLTIKKPYLSDLLAKLRNIDDYVKAEFVQAFNLHKNTFVGSMYEIKEVELRDAETSKKIGKGYEVAHSVQNLSNVGGINRFIKNNWHHNFLKKFSTAQELNENINTELGKLRTKLIAIRPNAENIAESSVEVRKILEDLGIATSADGFTHYLDNLETNSKTLEEKAQKLIKLKNSVNFLLTGIIDGKVGVISSNPFDTQGELTTLSNAEAFYISEGSDASIFTTGKSKWLYSYPSYLSTKVKSWKRDRNILLGEYNTSPYTKGSYYMRFLLALDEKLDDEARIELSKQRINDFDLVVFNSLQEVGDAANAVDNKDISKNDFYADIYNKMLGFKKSENGVSYINTATPADKGTQYQFALPTGMVINANARFEQGRVVVSDEATNVVFNHINGEFERIKQTQREIDLAEETGDRSKLRMYKHINGDKRPNGLNFQSFPELNFDPENVGKGEFALFDSVGRPILTMNLESVREHINNIINKTFQEDIITVGKQLRDIGLVYRNELGQTINKGFDTEIWNSYKGSPDTALKVAADIYINGLISQLEYSKMFAGDTAFYKNMVDYKKRIPATYTDGLQLYLRPGEEFFKAAIIEGVEIPTRYMEELVELVGKDIADKYNKINSTDAQAWITPERWMFLKQRLGKWSAKDDVVYNKLIGKNTEPFTTDELKRAAQPLKGVYFELNSGTPTYLKYSQAVLIPQILKNNKELQILADKMKDSKSDELITIDGIKVGANEPTLTHDKEGRVIEDFTLQPLSLKNSGWKLQQDLPIKTFKDTEVGSQIQKNIFAGLAFNREKTFVLEGEDISGEDLLNHINSIVENLSDKGKEKFKKEFGISSDNKIGDIDRLNRALVEELKTRRAPQNVIDALESGLSPFGIPGYQQKLQNIFSSIALKRLVKIKTNGGSFIQMSNYGFNKDEANNNGVKWTPWAEETTHEPRFLKDENGEFVLSESGKKIVRPGGILLSGSFIAKYVPNWAEMSQEKLFGTKEKDYNDGLIDQKILKNIIGYRIPNQGLASNDALEVVGILPEGMGDTVVAYTGITTKTGSDFDIDKMYLMLGGYKPDYKNKKKVQDYIYNTLRGATIQDTIENIQDLLVEIDTEVATTEDVNALADDIFSGNFEEYDERADLKFNVDELTYLLINSKNKSELVERIRNEIPGFNEVSRLNYITDNRSLEESSIEGLQNKLIEAYKAVLTHPEVIKDVMDPIDHVFMKDDIINAHPAPKTRGLSDFNLINEVELKYQFNAGGAGVGQTANALVDHVRGMMAELSFNNYYLGLGKVNEAGDTSFDAEFSEELSDVDYVYYTKITNEINKTKKPDEQIDVTKLRKIKTASSLSAILNANVDIAKDPYITRGNWTTQTANVGFMLLRAGVHPFKVNAIIGQPIIKDYIEFVTNAESKINKNTGNIVEKFVEDSVKKELDKQKITINGITKNYRAIYESTKGNITKGSLSTLFKGEVSDANVTDISSTINDVKKKYVKNSKFKIGDLSLQQLREQITKEGAKDVGLQMDIFHIFAEWQQNYSKKLVNNIKASKADTSGYGKNVASMIITRNLIDKLLYNSNNDGDFKGFDSKLITYGEEVLEQQVKVKEGVSDIFEENKELAEIGTEQQYSSYLDTVHPESKVKDIVYHGSSNKDAVLKEGFIPKRKDDLIYFTYNSESAFIKKDKSNLITAVVNLKNPIESEAEFSEFGMEEVVDGYYDRMQESKTLEQLGVKQSEQIHILGSKKDIKGFKDYVGGIQQQTKPVRRKTILGTYIENDVNFVNEVMQANPLTFLIATPTIVNTFNEISKGSTGDILLDEKLANKLENGYYSYMMSGFPALQMTEADRTDILESTVKEVDALKKTSKNFLIEELDIKVAEDGTKFIGMSNRKKSPTIENDLSTAWADLLEENTELGEKLIKYSYLTSGFQMSLNQFYTYIPFEWFAKNNLNDYINDLAIDLNKQSLNIDNTFMKDFAKSNIEDFQISPMVISKEVSDKHLNSKYGFVLDKPSETPAKTWVKRSITSERVKKKQKVKGKMWLYELAGYTGDNEAVYIAESTLGFEDKKGYKVIEYNMNQPDNVSNFEANNIDITDTIKNAFRQLVVKDTTGNVVNNTVAEAISSEVPPSKITAPVSAKAVLKGEEVIPKYYTGNITPEPNTIFVFGSNPEGRHGGGNAKVAKTKFGVKEKEFKSENTFGLFTKDLMGYANFDKSILQVSPFGGVYYKSEDATFWKDKIDYKGKRYNKLDDGTATTGNIKEGLLRKETQFERASEGGKWLHKLPSSFIEVKIAELYEEAKNNPTKQYKIAYNTDVTKRSLNGYTGLEMIEMFKNAGEIPSNIILSEEWYKAMNNNINIKKPKKKQTIVDPNQTSLFNNQGDPTQMDCQ